MRAAAILVLLALGAAELWWRWAYSLTPYDYPELWALVPRDFSGTSPLVGSLLLAFGAAAAAGSFLRPALAPPLVLAFVAVLNLVSLVQVGRWQTVHARAFGPFGAPAAAFAALLPPASLDRGVVVGADRGLVTYALFNLRSRSRVLLLPPGEALSPALVGEAEWVLVQGDYDLQFPGTTPLRAGRITFIPLGSPAPLAARP